MNFETTGTHRTDKGIASEGGGVATQNETVLFRRDERKRMEHAPTSGHVSRDEPMEAVITEQGPT